VSPGFEASAPFNIHKFLFITTMAGLYIHIPFCKQRCTYCDFHTIIAPKQMPELVESLMQEMHLRKDYLKNERIETIYFGGGTPSLLTPTMFQQIFSTIYELFSVDENAEITFEANPDDINPDYLQDISALPFNRISMGIQSFDDVDLKAVNRRHTASQAVEAVKNAQNAGFNNISIDLIYGLPNQTLTSWQKQIEQAFKLNVQHISVYGLTFEKGTKLWRQRENAELEAIDDDMMNEMYDLLLKTMDENGFEAYEISNFAKLGFRSRHNSAYWKLNPYLGIGPSAHSYDGDSRQWNVSSNTKYIRAIRDNKEYFEREILTTNENYNDYVMISLRTREGADLDFIKNTYGVSYLNNCLQSADKYILNGMLIVDGNYLKFSKKGIQLSNIVISDLMQV
jgi:oxygen-independent coproporphyrinogen-3 oxidase